MSGPDCPHCKNRGYIAILNESDLGGNDYPTMDLRECACMPARVSLQVLKRSGLADQIQNCTFEKFQETYEWQKRIKSNAQSFVNDQLGKGFFIGGQVGCGKTHLCTAIVVELIRQGNTAMYMKWREDSMKLKAYNDDDFNYIQEISRFKNAKVLYIDDFFKGAKGERPSNADIKMAFDLIDTRYRDKTLITVISSELYVGEIMDIDSAIGSRIFEMVKGFNNPVDRNDNRNMRLFDLSRKREGDRNEKLPKTD